MKYCNIMPTKNKWIVLLMVCMVNGLHAQQNDNSPFSRFGIGEMSDGNFMHSRMMGGLGASYIDGYHINIVNPASLATLNSTAFDVGVFGKYTTLSDSKNTSSFWSGNLDYMSLAFPLRNPINEIYDGVKRDYKLAMAISLMPHSTVSYNVAFVDSTLLAGPFTRNYIGNGGSYKFMWSNAIRYKSVSFGLNTGYLFGRLQYDHNLVFPSSAFAYSDYYSNNYNIRGFLWNAGVIYTTILNKKGIEKNKILPVKRISAGFHVNSSSTFSTLYNVNHRQEQRLPGSLLNVDTIRIVNEVAGKGQLPAEWGAGATYYAGEKFALGLNYSSSIWSEYFNEASQEVKGALKNAAKWSIGGYYRPDYKSYDSFFERIYYRYGFFYQTDARSIQGEQLSAIAASFGLGMPFVYQRKISHLNIGMIAGKRGQGSSVSENFVKIVFGVTFNDDEWFLKRKYN
jgi:hypothetical protein